jgi:hypothetical protein
MRGRLLRGLSAALFAAGCATSAPSGGTATTPSPKPASTTSGIGSSSQARPWRVTTYEHVDLWLHGFAMLTSDTGHVPFFARGYKQEIAARKKQQNVYTNLDANQQQLSQRFAANPALANAQFLAMYFSSFPELASATDLLVRTNGQPGRASDPVTQQQIALLAANFPTAADRNWARLFVQSLQDESSRFYHAYWTAEQQVRGAAFAQVNQQWIGKYYPKLARFLNNTQQANGELILSLPLGGEGRTINNSKQSNSVAVLFPRTVETADEAMYAFVHEVVARLVDEAVRDNTTPAEQRSGVTAGYTGNGAVRGGALLLERTVPDAVPGYMRFYLRELGRTVPTGDPRTAFEAAFPLPQAIVASLAKSIEGVLGGI